MDIFVKLGFPFPGSDDKREPDWVSRPPRLLLRSDQVLEGLLLYTPTEGTGAAPTGCLTFFDRRSFPWRIFLGTFSLAHFLWHDGAPNGAYGTITKRPSS